MQVYTDGMGAMKVDFRKGKADMQDLWNVLQTKLLIPPPPPPCVECKGVGCNGGELTELVALSAC